MKISISGLGYVGLSNALLLAKNNEVIAYDSSSDLIKNLKEKKTHLSDQLIKDSDLPLGSLSQIDCPWYLGDIYRPRFRRIDRRLLALHTRHPLVSVH